MLIYERDPRQRQLPLLYTPQEPRRVMPSELAEEIVLTHPAQPEASSFHEIRQSVVTAPLGAASINGTLALADRYLWMLTMIATHDDITTRRIEIGIQELGSGNEFPVFFDEAVSAGQFVIARSVLVPQGWRAYARADAIAAGSFIRLSQLFLNLLEAERYPYA